MPYLGGKNKGGHHSGIGGKEKPPPCEIQKIERIGEVGMII